MKQFAKLVTLGALALISGVSLNTQAVESEDFTFKSNLELQMTRLKMEALVNLAYQVKTELKTNSGFYAGNVAKSVATNKLLAQHSVRVNNLEKLAD